MADSGSTRENVTRRDAMRRGAGISAVVLGGAALASLSGCETGSQKRMKKLGGQLGQPIEADPVAVYSRPSPIQHSIPSHSSPIARASLDVVPSFVVARSKWTGGKPRTWLADPMGSVSRITVHHDAISPIPSGSYGDSVRRLSAIRKGHLGRGWADIGYHYAIDPSGRVWQARPLTLQGAHVKDKNPNNLGIVMFGNYEKIQPTDRAMDSLNRLLAHEMLRFNVPINRVYTHRELASTACPGRNLQAKMIRVRAKGGELAQLLTNSSALT